MTLTKHRLNSIMCNLGFLLEGLPSGKARRVVLADLKAVQKELKEVKR